VNILVQLSHPAQFHFYRIAINRWRDDGNKVIVVIKSKDILEDIVKESGCEYVNINARQHRHSSLGLLFDMLWRDIRMAAICIREKIDLLTGSGAEVAQVGWLLRRYSICIGEDDADTVPSYVRCVLPFLQTRLTPDSCRCGPMEPKSIHYSGFQKLAYLHPNVFTKKEEILHKYGLRADETYFIIRLVGLGAHHDGGKKGLSDRLVQELLMILNEYGRTFISSERPLPPEFERCRLVIDPLDIHHVLAFSTLFIGDSQSMAVESAMLGVPNIRFNDFTGKHNIGVLEELEDKYGLTASISTDEPDLLKRTVSDMVSDTMLRNIWQERLKVMISQKIDVSAFLIWFVENYPVSYGIMKNNPSFQNRFNLHYSYYSVTKELNGGASA